MMLPFQCQLFYAEERLRRQALQTVALRHHPLVDFALDVLTVNLNLFLPNAEAAVTKRKGVKSFCTNPAKTSRQK